MVARGSPRGSFLLSTLRVLEPLASLAVQGVDMEKDIIYILATDRGYQVVRSYQDEVPQPSPDESFFTEEIEARFVAEAMDMADPADYGIRVVQALL
jgi:hypothetical protein